MERLAGARVGKAELPCVEHLTLILAGLAACVKGVAEERMAEVLEVDADLMGAAGVEGTLDEGADAGELLEDAPAGTGGASAAVEDGHFFSMDGMAADGILDGAAAWAGEVAADEGEVDLRHRPAGKLAGEMGVGEVVLCDDQAAAGVLVQAMDDAGALLAADGAEGAAMGQQGMDERMAGVASGGMDDEAGGLVEDEEVRVFVEDIERDILGLQEGGLGGGLGDSHESAVADGVAGFGGFSGEGDVALFDEGLEARAGEVRQHAGKESVQPISRGARINQELRHVLE
jgi:hypothetical protein